MEEKYDKNNLSSHPGISRTGKEKTTKDFPSKISRIITCSRKGEIKE